VNGGKPSSDEQPSVEKNLNRGDLSVDRRAGVETQINITRSSGTNARHSKKDCQCQIIEKKLFLRAAGTQRCAGEGELLFGLTGHGATLPAGGRRVN
jgi:hypothetical protein